MEFNYPIAVWNMKPTFVVDYTMTHIRHFFDIAHRKRTRDKSFQWSQLRITHLLNKNTGLKFVGCANFNCTFLHKSNCKNKNSEAGIMSADNIRLGARRSGRQLPMVVLSGNDNSNDPPDSDDERELIERLQDQYGEYAGKVQASRCESHPFIRSIFMFQLFLGLFGALVTVQPFFIFMSTDGTAMQIALFIIQLLLAGVVAIGAHDARMEEMLFLVRCRGYGEATKLSIYIPVAVVFFAICVMSQLVANMVAARRGDLQIWVHIMLTLTCSLEICVAILMVQRQRNHYILNDM